MLSPTELQTFDDLLVDLNAVAAEVILPIFRADLGIENKKSAVGGAEYDPVTLADKGAEAAIRRLLAERHPDHGVIGEEYGEDRPDAEFVWVLDPIDGTRAFVAGLPVWTTLIGLRHEGKPVLGSIGQSFTGELFIGHAGGSRLQTEAGSKPLKARSGVALRDAVIATTDPDIYLRDPAMVDAWRRLRAVARLARLGCDAYAYAMVAAGQIDLVVEATLKCWDIDAAIPVLAGAGAITSDWSGEPIGSAGGQVALAGSRALLDEAVVILKAAAG
jgi:histidinol phosphatase-like enzyme (inositol monophosphatase family)